MITALPNRGNLVEIKGEFQGRLLRGRLWFGGTHTPLIFGVKREEGERPAVIPGLDMISADDELVVYGNKHLIRYGIDTVDNRNRLLFYGIKAPASECSLIRWLIRKTGDMVSNDAILRMASVLQKDVSLLYYWCNVLNDVFCPERRGYEVYNEPPSDIVRKIVQAANRTRLGR